MTQTVEDMKKKIIHVQIEYGSGEDPAVGDRDDEGGGARARYPDGRGTSRSGPEGQNRTQKGEGRSLESKALISR